MELSSLAPNNIAIALAAARPERPGPDPKRVEPQQDADKAGLSGRETAQGEKSAAEAREMQMRASRDENRPAGPPPSFDITLLEMERDLQRVLARLDSAHARERDGVAVRPGGEAGGEERAVQPPPGPPAASPADAGADPDPQAAPIAPETPEPA